jgi:hypothetical protein
MNNVKEMFKSWRKFLDQARVSESITDRSLEAGEDHSVTFSRFFGTSEKTLMLALDMINSAIEDAKALKTLDLADEEYRKKANFLLSGENNVVDNEKIDQYIEKMKSIQAQLEATLKLGE